MPIVAICPGANFSSKIWPVDRFAEVGKRIIGQIHMEPLVIGGPLEAALGDQLVETWGCGANAAGKFTVMESAALMSHARFLLGLDTGTTHLAASLGIPCVALFSEHNHPGQWEPLGGGHIVIREKVPCVACRMRICPIPEHPCMSNISVDRVWNSVVEMAKRRGAGSVATESTLVGM
jgi:ADP-heptose:LPS heptosyltransferase